MAGTQWPGTRVTVTGGASFIGSHLVDALLVRGAEVRVVDDLSSGTRENLRVHLDSEAIEFIHGDLRESEVARAAVRDRDVVFHHAADHGGRGYLELHQAGPASNFCLDGQVFFQALRAGVGKVVFASSGCVYPNHLQDDPQAVVYLKESLVRQPYDADNSYGWAKLMGELTLRAYHEEFGLGAACCRYFTAYGPRAKESHAVMAMIARARVRQSPFEIWGTGTQVRNWTYVDDIVEGTLAAAENVNDGTAVNIGTSERTTVTEAAQLVLALTGHDAEIQLRPDMPTGPLNRVADNSLAHELFGWSPRVAFEDGLKRTIDWYFEERPVEKVRAALEHELTDRHGEAGEA
jgi:nucleoside-diphosphate-sugar epimerase